MLVASKENLTSSQLDEAAEFGKRVNKLGVNFVVVDVGGELALRCDGRRFESNAEELAGYAEKVFQQVFQKQADSDNHSNDLDEPVKFGENGNILAVPLGSAKKIIGVGIMDLGLEDNASNNEELRRFCQQHQIDPQLLVNMVNGGEKRDNDYCAQMLVGFAESFRKATKAVEQMDMISTELSQTYEELVLLYKMSTNMKLTESASNYLQIACDNITELVSAEGIAILLEKPAEHEKKLILTAGAGLIDINEQLADILYSRLQEEITLGKEALLDSEVDSPFKYKWPEWIKNIIAVPLYGNNKTTGMMVAINRIDKADFDTIDVKLFNSVANECAVFIENGRLFKDLKELFIGSLKALTNSIDAKDEYTHGHSERVALISRWIAERLAEQEDVEEEQIHKVYLAGLLHDIGKIGIDEAVLCKDGALNEQERTIIKLHPSIGANILSEIKLMRDIVPGVLCHHERADGNGYPNGFSSEKIPLIGKIVMLADCFDAMTSKRSYREAMSVAQAIEQIEQGLGTQFDEKIGRLFLDSDPYQLWNILQDQLVESTYQKGFTEYETMAVGALVR